MGRNHDLARWEELRQRSADHVQTHGLSGLSMRSLSSGIGVSSRMLVHHFGSKDGLLLEVAHAVGERQRDDVLRNCPDVRGRDLLLWRFERVTARRWGVYNRFVLGLMGVSLQEPTRFPGFAAGIHRRVRVSVSKHLAGASGVRLTESAATAVAASLVGLAIEVVATGERKRIGKALQAVAQIYGDG